MYCTNCGQPRPDDAVTCPNCNATIRRPALPGGPAVKIPNYLVQSVLVTLCCCLPFGIVAVVNAARVDSLLAAGDVAGAMQASKNAKMWCWIGFAGGFVSVIAYFLLGVIGNVRT